MMTRPVEFTEISGEVSDPYQTEIERIYQDEPAAWQQVIGQSLWFQFGVYDGPSASRWTPEEAGRSYFERQLNLAGLTGAGRPPIARVLDVGCGWGAVLDYLPHRLPDCPRFDGINISPRQMRYSAQLLATHGLSDRVRLYLCNARDIALLPDPATPFDLVIMRGVITHFTSEVLDATFAALAARMCLGATVVITDNLHNGDLPEYRSTIPDPTDRLACGHRKTLPHLTEVLKAHDFTIHDARVLPSNEDAIRWLHQVKTNIETHFTPDDLPGPLAELRDTAINWTAALHRNAVSVYSIIATLGESDRAAEK